MAVLVTNNAKGTLATGINDSELSLTLDSGQGALFPNPTGGDVFYATIVDASNNKEIVLVTARVSQTLTIVRGQDGTTPRSFDAGSRVGLRFIAAIHNLYAQKGSDNSFTAEQTFLAGTAVRGSAGTIRKQSFRTGALDRWVIGASSDAEAGDNVGSNYFINRHDDAGTVIDTVFAIDRATGAVTHGSNKADSFPSGTSLVFYQAAAPTGWTAEDIHNKALRVVNQTSGVGGTDGGTTAFTSVFTNRTINANNLPLHTHAFSGSGPAHSHVAGSENFLTVVTGVSGSGISVSTASVTHTISWASGSSTANATPSGIGTFAVGNNTTSASAMDFAVQYSSVIIATKD